MPKKSRKIKKGKQEYVNFKILQCKIWGNITMKPKILIVDDEYLMRKFMELAFSQEYELVEAGDGAEAIEKYKSEKPDIVLMDLLMPGVGGVDAAESLFKLDPQVKIIIITALNQIGLVRKLVKKGVYDYLTKPFDTKKLRSSIERALKDRKK